MARNEFYNYRGWPCRDRTWNVSGQDNHDGISAGVLEWCDDEEDARARLRIMVQYPQFTHLSIGKWED